MASANSDGRVAVRTPYQLDLPQTTQACKVLIKHISEERRRREAQSKRPNLLAFGGGVDAEDASADDQEPIWLILTTKKHIVDQKKLKPSKISLPHSINTSEISTICLITADPQATYTALVASASFPANLRSRITRTISLIHLKKNYATFESRRALFASHDLFLADDRIVTHLPGVLGKIFYKGGSKRPIPVNIAESRERDSEGKRIKIDPATAKKVKDKEEGGRGAATPEAAGREITKALGSAVINLAPGTSTAVKVGLAGMTPQAVTENVNAVVEGLVERFITKGWKNVRAIHIKGPNTASFPVWLANELWVDEEDVLEEKKAFGKKGKRDLAGITEPRALANDEDGEQSRKRKADETKKPSAAKHAKKKRKLADEEKAADEVKARKELLKKQKTAALAQAV